MMVQAFIGGAGGRSRASRGLEDCKVTGPGRNEQILEVRRELLMPLRAVGSWQAGELA